MNRVRLVDDLNLLRRVAYSAAGGAAVISMVATLAVSPDGFGILAAYAIPVTVFLSLPSQRWRASVLAFGAGLVAMATGGDTVPLWLGVTALVFGSVAEDLRPVPWIGWAGGLVGALLSGFVTTDPIVAPFLAVILGASLALLLRARLHTLRLAEEAVELRDRAAWLEQRTILARELHDVLGHHVTAMVVQAEAGQMRDANAALLNIGELGRAALGDLDALVVHLRDPDSPFGVPPTPRLLDIDELLAAPLRLLGVDVTVRTDPDLGLTEPEVLTVYRIAQEALTNVIRHARATHAWVELSRSGDRARLRVSDDGIGIGKAAGRGSGILGIAERVTARSGSWDITERPGGGTVLDASFPLEQP